jgi:predicted nucleic-acid-binding protein
MIAVDTNIVVRLLTADDAEQAAQARKLFEADQVFVARTVLLETAWVLKSSYEQPPEHILDAITRLLGLPNVVVEEADRVADALDLARGGIDLADALHLSACPESVPFATFDRPLARAAEKAAGGVSVRLLS